MLAPQDHIAPAELERGLRALLRDGVCSQIMSALTGGAFLIAFAIHLEASHLAIGLIAAAQPLAQVLQIPAVLLVERIRRRKLLVVTIAFTSRLVWPIVASLPWIAPPGSRVPVLLGLLVTHFGLGAVSGCAYSSWMRDLIPDERRGRYFGKRAAVSTAVGAGLTIPAALLVDATGRGGEHVEVIFGLLFAIGTVAGLTGCYFLSRIPEPRMAPASGPVRLSRSLRVPLQDLNFRNLLRFLGSWNFAIHLAAPFFTVYLLERLGLSMVWVMGLTVLSEILHATFVRLWGKLADRFSNKSVLSVSGWLFVVSIALWPFTTLPDRYLLTVPLLIAIHALAGISTAGVKLCSSTIALELAPKGQATAFLAVNAITVGLAATAAPILAGLGADRLMDERLVLELRSSTAGGAERFSIGAFDLQGLDFLFIAAVVFGLYALHRLLAVKEEGEVDGDVVIEEFYAEVRRVVRHVSSVAGLRQLSDVPPGVLHPPGDPRETTGPG